MTSIACILRYSSMLAVLCGIGLAAPVEAAGVKAAWAGLDRDARQVCKKEFRGWRRSGAEGGFTCSALAGGGSQQKLAVIKASVPTGTTTASASSTGTGTDCCTGPIVRQQPNPAFGPSNQFAAAMFPALPDGVGRGNYVVTNAEGKAAFDPFASNWIADLVAAGNLSNIPGLNANLKILGIKAVSGLEYAKWDGKLLYLKTLTPGHGTQPPAVFDLYTDQGCLRSLVWGNEHSPIAKDTKVNVSAFQNNGFFDIPFAEFLKSASDADGDPLRLLFITKITGGTYQVDFDKQIVRVFSTQDKFEIRWIAGDGRTTDGAVFTGYRQASPAGGTSAGVFF